MQGVIEADETYVGGKPRKKNKHDDDDNIPRRGRATSKVPVIGAVERGGKVVARVSDNVSGRRIMQFIQKSIEPDGSLLITDEFKAYNAVRSIINHAVINHSRSYVYGMFHTNTIEGVWSLLKRAWYGSHHHYRRQYMPLYIGETCWKYNCRKDDNLFGTFIRGCFA